MSLELSSPVEFPNAGRVPGSQEEAVGPGGHGRLAKKVESSGSRLAEGKRKNRGELPVGVDLLDPGRSRTRNRGGADPEKEQPLPGNYQKPFCEAYQASPAEDSAALLKSRPQGESVQNEASLIQDPKQGILQGQGHRVFKLTRARALSTYASSQSRRTIEEVHLSQSPVQKNPTLFPFHCVFHRKDPGQDKAPQGR